MVGEEEKVWPFVDPGKKRKKLRIWSRLWQDTEMMTAGKNKNKEKWGMRFGPTRCAARPSSSSALAHIIHSPANITSGFQHKSSDSLWTAPLWFSFFGFFLLYPPVCLLVFSLSWLVQLSVTQVAFWPGILFVRGGFLVVQWQVTRQWQ
jgi:hypothetical protein